MGADPVQVQGAHVETSQTTEAPLLPTPPLKWLTGSSHSPPVSTRIAVLWEVNGQTLPFEGVITEIVREIDGHNMECLKHMVEYTNNDRFLTNLRHFTYRILEVGQPTTTPVQPGQPNADRRSSRPRKPCADRYFPPSSPL
jgi:hypothetical protein